MPEDAAFALTRTIGGGAGLDSTIAASALFMTDASSVSTWIIERVDGPGRVETTDRIVLRTFLEFTQGVPFENFVTGFTMGHNVQYFQFFAEASPPQYFVTKWTIWLDSRPVIAEPPVQLSAPYLLTRFVDVSKHVDMDPKPIAFADPYGGDRTYDGHTGTDFQPVWPQFRQMHLGGIDVVAAAPGVVGEVLDGAEDRCHGSPAFCPGGGLNQNRIAVVHRDGTIAVYAHNKRGSNLVKVGDEVECGTLLAKIGSAGDSSGPHLHFEVRRPVDPHYFDRNPGPALPGVYLNQTFPVDPFSERLWFNQRTTVTPPYEEPTLTCLPLTEKKWEDRLLQNDDIVLRSFVDLGGEFDPCYGFFTCGFDMYCGEDRSGRVCLPLGGVNDPCQDRSQCKYPLECRDGRCSAVPCTDQCPTYRGCYRVGGDCKVDFLRSALTFETCGTPASCPSHCLLAPIVGCIQIEVHSEQVTGPCSEECLP